jgi:hypothetical protein
MVEVQIWRWQKRLGRESSLEDEASEVINAGKQECKQMTHGSPSVKG